MPAFVSAPMPDAVVALHRPVPIPAGFSLPFLRDLLASSMAGCDSLPDPSHPAVFSNRLGSLSTSGSPFGFLVLLSHAVSARSGRPRCLSSAASHWQMTILCQSLSGPQGFLLHSVTRLLRPCLFSTIRRSDNLCSRLASGYAFRDSVFYSSPKLAGAKQEVFPG